MFLPTSRRRTIDGNKDTQFNDTWIALSIILALIGLALNNPFLTGLAAVLLIVTGSTWLWARVSLRGLHYDRAFSEIRAFQGEQIELVLEVANQKPLPQPWVSVRDFFPNDLPIAVERLDAAKLDVNPSTNLAEFNSFWMLGPYQRVTRRFTVEATTRGFHKFGPSQVTTGDPFGFFDRAIEQPDTQYLIVYPRIYATADLRIPTKNPFGQVRVTGSIYDDPLRPAGVRPWQPEDALRRVHWKATARRQTLLSRIYEPSEEQVVQLFLNVTTLTRHWHGYIPELQERAISVAASLAALAVEERLPVGLIANGALPGADQSIRLLPGRSPNQLLHILELLAAVTPFATQPIEELVVQQAPHLPWGATLVVVSAIAHDDLLAILIDLAAAGRRVVLFTLAEEPPQHLLPGVTVYHLPHLIDDLIAPVHVATPAL